jgi:hypothetical protein
VISADPEIMALQDMLREVGRLNRKTLTERQLTIVIAVKLCIKAFKINPTASQIAHASGEVPSKALDEDIAELVRLRYLHECEPKPFGKPVITYRLGTAGGSTLRRLVAPDKKDEAHV